MNAAPEWRVSYDAMTGARAVDTNDVTAVSLPAEARMVRYRRSYHASRRLCMKRSSSSAQAWAERTCPRPGCDRRRPRSSTSRRLAG
jgi:hypothetical protein